MIAFQNPKLLILILPIIVALFIIIRLDFVRFKDKDEQEIYDRQRKGMRRFMLVSRCIIFLLLVVALASPYIVGQIVSSGSPSLTIFIDKSKSFELFDQSVADNLKSELEKQMPVNVKYMGSDNSSAIGDALLNNMQGSDSVLIVSDGNNNYGRSLGDIMVFSSLLNSTISYVKLAPVKKDTGVWINGPSVTTADVDNSFDVAVKQVGGDAPYSVQVKLDSQVVLNEAFTGSKSFSFTTKLSEGYHTLEADVSTADDYFSENNKFYKVVKVEPKPFVLFVSEKDSPLMKLLPELYNVQSAAALPSAAELKRYSAAIINDLPADKLSASALTDYVTDGNGLVVIGGKSAYDKGGYKKSVLEALLPVMVGSGVAEDKKNVNLVIVIDISGSTGGRFSENSGNSVEDVEKALAISVIDQLRPTDKVAVIAFNTDPYLVSDLSSVALKKYELRNNISQLTFLGGTSIFSGLYAANKLLLNVDGGKNIVLITDGDPQGSDGTKSDALRQAWLIANEGTKLITVGVGEGTNEEFLRELAQKGNGVYLQPSELQRLNLVFSRAGEDPQKRDAFAVELYDSSHFIARGVSLADAKVTGYNQVVPKTSASIIATTGDNHLILAVWRFGLGRIASLATDDGSAWAGSLLRPGNSLLLTRTFNWAIGDLSRSKSFDVQADDVFIGDSIDFAVKSSVDPKVEGAQLSKIDEEIYSGSLAPDKPGIYLIKFTNPSVSVPVAVNYNKEVYNVGMNPELSQLVYVTNGDAFEPSDISGIVEKVRQDSKRIKIEKKNYAWMFVLAALCLFLAEVCIRRIVETRRNTKV